MTTLVSLMIGIPIVLYSLTGIILCILDEDLSSKLRRSVLKIMVAAGPFILLAIYLLAK